MNCTIRVVKTKALISFGVAAKLICVFVLAYADCWFSHEAAHLCIFFVNFFILCRLMNPKIIESHYYVMRDCYFK